MEFPTEEDLELPQKIFESYQKEILEEIKEIKHYFTKFSKNNSRNTDLKENVQTNVNKTIGKILSELINGQKVEYNDDRFNYI